MKITLLFAFYMNIYIKTYQYAFNTCMKDKMLY